MNDDQFERIVGMLAENRVAITEVQNELSRHIQEQGARFREVYQNLRVLQASVDCIEPELNKIQQGLRTQAKILSEHSQTLDGVVQLSKSNFDIVESINQRQLEEQNRSATSTDVERQTQ